MKNKINSLKTKNGKKAKKGGKSKVAASSTEKIASPPSTPATLLAPTPSNPKSSAQDQSLNIPDDLNVSTDPKN